MGILRAHTGAIGCIVLKKQKSMYIVLTPSIKPSI